jgi:hypothetical protein
METMGRPRLYPDEFRHRAVRLVYEWRKERDVAVGGLQAVADRRAGREAFYRIAHPEVIDVLRSADTELSTARHIDDPWPALERAHLLSQPWAWTAPASTSPCSVSLSGSETGASSPAK